MGLCSPNSVFWNKAKFTCVYRVASGIYWTLLTIAGVIADDYSTEMEDEGAEPTMTIQTGENNIKDVFGKVMINRTRPMPCTMEVDLYQLAPERDRRPQTGPLNDCHPWVQCLWLTLSLLIDMLKHGNCMEQQKCQRGSRLKKRKIVWLKNLYWSFLDLTAKGYMNWIYLPYNP